MEITNVKFHRNGIDGEPFYSMRIIDGTCKRIAIITSSKGGCFVVDDICVDNMNACGYRGDQYESTCREAIIMDYMESHKVSSAVAREELNDGLKNPVY